MVRWLLAAALLSGSAFAQQAPMTAAEAAARARGETMTNPDANGRPAPGTMPSKDAVQRSQDRCKPDDERCADRQRELLSNEGAPSANPAAPAAATPPPATQDSPSAQAPGLFGSTLIGLGSPAQNAPGGLAGAAAVPTHPIEISAYFILGGQWVQQDPNYLYVGRNNGFSIADARLEVTGRPTENLWLFLSFDGAIAARSATDSSQGSRTVGLKDAYGVYSPGFHLRIEAGQFKAPQDVEHLLEETEIKFPTRSLLTDGLRTPAGYDTNGLSLDRQIGIALGTDVIALPFGSIAAQVMIANGNGANTLFNNTSTPGVIGRVALGLFGIVSLGGDAYFMPQATGTQPDLFRDNWTGFGGDIRVEYQGIHLMGLVQSRSVEHVTSNQVSERSFGFTVEGAYRLPGKLSFIEPAVRYASLDPTDKVMATDGSALLKVSAIDAALNFYAPGTGAARLSLAYVHRMENDSRAISNDGLDMSLQVSF
jgi:hypothetical protein